METSQLQNYICNAHRVPLVKNIQFPQGWPSEQLNLEWYPVKCKLTSNHLSNQKIMIKYEIVV